MRLWVWPEGCDKMVMRWIMGIVTIGASAIAGYLIRDMTKPIPESTDKGCRDLGYIKPEECPEEAPCPPYDQIESKEECERCGGQWKRIGFDITGQLPTFGCVPPVPESGPVLGRDQSNDIAGKELRSG
jgi:hypothetical protein